MVINWADAGPSVTAAFMASIVEFVEALTVILAVGTVRGWRWSLAGAAGGACVLLAMIIVLGPALARIPLQTVQLAVGALLLLFGLRWLRKGILRSARIIPLHDEMVAFEKQSESMRNLGASREGWDPIAFAASFKITMLEGVEVVFIVIAVGAGRAGLLIPAALGALAALVLVIVVGVLVHRPLARVPENTLKLAVGVLLSAFGTFWFGEGIGVTWKGGDLAIVALALAFLATSLLGVAFARRLALRARAAVG